MAPNENPSSNLHAVGTPIHANTTDAWKEEVQKKVMADRDEQRKKRFSDLAKYYDSKMNTLLDTFFSIYSDIEEENDSTFNLLNSEWMSFCHKANATQKIIDVKPDMFAKNVKAVKESPDFKNRNKPVNEEAVATD